MEHYSQKVLQQSKPYKDNFYSDSFHLFQYHYPHLFELQPDGFRIIYKDEQRTVRSKFNMLGTNYTAYAYLINSTIDEMVERNIISNASDVNPLTDAGYEKILNFLLEDKPFFASLLQGIGEIISATSGAGDRAEIGAEEVIKRIFGQDVEIRKTAGLGEKEDTLGGKDRVFIKNGKTYNVQVKACKKIEEENGQYFIDHLGAKLYRNIDIMIFKRNSWYFVFNIKDASGNPVVQILGDREGYIIPSKYCIKKVKLESK